MGLHLSNDDNSGNFSIFNTTGLLCSWGLAVLSYYNSGLVKY